MGQFINEIIQAKWFVPLELSHSSYIYTALVAFCKTEKIPFKISSKNLNHRGKITIENEAISYSKHYNTKINCVQFKVSSGRTVMIAFDLDDNPYCFSEYALKTSDVYFKRCYQEDAINIFSDNNKSKIKPLGLPFMVIPDRLPYIHKLKLYFYLFKISEIFRLDSLIIKRFKLFKIKAIQHFDGFRNTRLVSDFNNFNPDVFGNIFYQKRLFKETSDDVIMMNSQRIRIIRLLKDTFPNHFFGGLQNNQISKLHYPDLISNIKGDQHSFLETMKKCGICIYTNGLMGSPGWTLPEYLSQGNCIIAEGLENTLPFPLIDGEHLMYFSNEEELVVLCEELINDPENRLRLGRNARRYYNEHINPTVFFKNLLISNFE